MDDLETTPEGTVLFVPERLNRDPVVVRGLTSGEVFLAATAGAAFGLVLGLVLWPLTGQIALLPTSMMAIGPFASLFFGGALLRRLKRGKPDTWVYRLLNFRLQQRFGLSFGQKLTTRSGHWTIRRSERYWPKRLALTSQPDEQGAL